MKSILEQALVHLLNQRTDMAEELMHQFVVERAKEIHESLRESDEMDLENLDDAALEEEFFTEADLEDAEAADNLADDLDDAGVSDEDLGGGEADMGAEFGAEVADAGVAGEVDGEVEMGGEEAVGEVDLADKIDELEDEIKAMQDEFDRIMAEFDSAEGEGDADVDAEAGFEAPAEVEGGEGDVSLADAEVEDGEDFDEITESMVDDLKKVTTPNQDGKGATGQTLGTDTDSPIAKDAKNTVLASKKTVGHTGWERETAPSKKDGPDRGRKYDNNRPKATDGNAPVPATGPKGAELNKPVAGNTKSIIPGSKINSKK